MGYLRLDQVKEGMELAADVADRNGQVLVRSGATITARELRLFRMWGIEELNISGLEEQSAAVTPAIDPAILAQYEPKAREIYKHAPLDHPVMRQLFETTIQRLADRDHYGALHGS